MVEIERGWHVASWANGIEALGFAMKLRVHVFDLPLRHVFTISRESISVQPTLIVELEQDGVRGYGEATTNSYYNATREAMTVALERLRPALESLSCDDPAALWERFAGELRDQPFAQCALDQAAYDLWGKLRGAPVHKLWGLEAERLPLTNYTIGIDSIEVMVAKMNEFPGWPVYKIKLGTARDLDIVRELRRHTSAVFRVDANCGWTAEQTIANSRVLSELNVEFIEQPLPADQWEAMKRVRAESALPVIADESCVVESDVARCAGFFHGVNIKLVKCGGLTPARRMIAAARRFDMKVMVGCMTESTVGISAIAQLLPLLDYVDMDGALLLARDIATGVRINQGRCVYPSTAGSGVSLLAAADA
jgi:L-alanine-DL-glutamate epimerase-like enolase superfamily enzyme